MKKRDGSVGDIMMSGLVIIAIFILMFAFLSVMQREEMDEKVDQLGRKYILEMEAKGYLQPASRTALTQELLNIGVTDIDLSGTTFSDVGYGNPIYLKISCSIPYEKWSTTGDLFAFFREDAEYPIHVEKMSTAKN